MITVLLAVFDGEKYLREQIDSIINQTISDIRIVIRDDGSKDSSPLIIDEYAKKYPDRITVICGEPTGSAMSNFHEMLKAVDDDYIMLSDQDDVWHENKAQITLDAMLKAESRAPQGPILVHTDLTVSDSDMNTIANSFFEYQKVYPDGLTLNRLLVQNYVTGCTVMINRALKNRALPIPSGAVMHDWWLALVACLFGTVVTIKQPTVYYRQHGDNQVGAKAGGGLGFVARKLKSLGEVRVNVSDTYRQAQLLLNSYSDIISDDKRALLKAYVGMQKASRINKIRTINKYNFKKCTGLRVAGQYLLG